MAKLNQSTAHIIRDLARLGYGITDIKLILTPGAATLNQIKNVIRWCIKMNYATPKQMRRSYSMVDLVYKGDFIIPLNIYRELVEKYKA